MPMIDITAVRGTFADPQGLAQEAARIVMEVEAVPPIPMFRQNTAGFVHELEAGHFSNVDGGSTHVRVQVLTNRGALDRDKQIAIVRRLTDLVVSAANDPSLADRTWVLLTEAADGALGPVGPRTHQRRTGHCGSCRDRQAEGLGLSGSGRPHHRLTAVPLPRKRERHPDCAFRRLHPGHHMRWLHLRPCRVRPAC